MVVPYTLFQLCTRWVGSNINKFSGSNVALPEEVVDRVLAYFMANRTLNAEVLAAFLSTTFKHLSLDEGGWLSVDCFTSIPRLCPSLQSLSLANCTQLPIETLDMITKECKELRALSLRGCKQLNDAAMLRITQNCNQLIYLDLHSVNKITPAGIASIADNCPQLEFLGLGECNLINNAAIQHLAKLSNLKELNLRMCALVSDNGIAALLEGPASKSLLSIDISHCGKITDVGLKTISSMSQIRNLNFNGMMKITPAGVDDVSKGCTNLEVLNIAKCRLLDDQAFKSVFANARNIVNLDLSFLEITDAAFSVLPATLPITCLVLTGAARITDVALKNIAASMPYLQILNLWKCSLISDEGVVAIGRSCNRLRMIQLSECTKITDKSVFALASGCPQLSTVLLGGWATITDAGIKALSQNCKDIRTIDLGGLVNITNQSLTYLSESCPNLYSISLYDCKSVTAEGLHQLVGHAPALRRIDLGGKTGLTTEQASHLAKRFSHLELAV